MELRTEIILYRTIILIKMTTITATYIGVHIPYLKQFHSYGLLVSQKSDMLVYIYLKDVV